jgi:hypothetical protein
MACGKCGRCRSVAAQRKKEEMINKETMDKAIASGLRTVIGKTPDPATIEQLPNGNFRFKIAQAPRKPRADKGTRRATTTTTSNKGAV